MSVPAPARGDGARVVAHRGRSGAHPDNSLAAFEEAIAVGAHMIELDVRRTADRRLVAFHDAEAGGRPVASLTREEVGMRAGALPPLLDEVLELARGRIGVDVEIKEDGYTADVVAGVMRLADPADVIVTSFLDAVVDGVKRRAPELRTGLLIGRGRIPRRAPTPDLLPVRRALACRADHLAPHVALVPLGVLGQAAAAGLPCLVWTVNRPDLLRRHLSDPRIWGVITDEPARALALLGAGDGRS